ncbi:TIGR02647 family protein [Modicisalibacter luteus]|uniref:TIGR02647 family protein n=1 Tax=Modicisalibacter luteus TaxID=453962 RepID=A0ABV7LYU2_9GAMM|nr:TIGR02647 family protein [Halomonas lutea]GHA95532.1 TIGR02647 family protein [Halomonas lutea]
MTYTPDMIDELNVLCLFNLSTTHEGIKVHSSAMPEKVAATQRLYERGLVTQPDGGYLTGLGRDAATQAQNLLTILSTAPATT